MDTRIYDLLERIQKRPAFFLTSPTISALKDFLNGLSVGGYFRNQLEEEIPPFGDFSTWFCIHLDAPGAAGGGWYAAISSESSDEKRRFKRFFDYLDIYRQRVPVLAYRFTLTTAQREFYESHQRSKAPTHLRLTRFKNERCLFLRAKWPGSRNWSMHTGFTSLTNVRGYLTKVFRITDAQWRKATKSQSRG